MGLREYIEGSNPEKVFRYQKHSPPHLPRTVWALGFVSLFMDISSELIHSLLPVFLVTTMGASVGMVGLIEGVAEGRLWLRGSFPGV